MTEAASQMLSTMAMDYVKAGFPHPNTWAFQPLDPQHERVFNEWKALGLVQQRGMQMFILTDAGLSAILRQIPFSEAARELLQDLKQQYVEAGYPNRINWAFMPDSSSDEVTYNELRSRGYIEKRTVAMYILSAAGQSEIMRSASAHS